MAEKTMAAAYELFVEAAILHQIGTSFLEARLPQGVLVSHFGVISHLMRTDAGATPRALADALQVPKTTMTHTLQGLERRGLIEYRRNPDDGRSKFVCVSPSGEAFYHSAIAQLAPVFAAIDSRFPADRIRDLLPEIKAFRTAIDDLRNDLT